MYNILFGRNPHAKLILATLGLTEKDIGRFRDAFVSEGKIAIYTRLGGNNRQCWCANEEEHQQGWCGETYVKRLQSHPNYLYDEDDDFDNTYATFYFSLPPKYEAILREMDQGVFDPDKRWQEKLTEIEGASPEELKEKYPELWAIVEEIAKRVNEGKG